MLASHGATAPPGGMRLYVTDTLDDLHASLPAWLRLLRPGQHSVFLGREPAARPDCWRSRDTLVVPSLDRQSLLLPT
jgi:hypothetical protein